MNTRCHFPIITLLFVISNNNMSTHSAVPEYLQGVAPVSQSVYRNLFNYDKMVSRLKPFDASSGSESKAEAVSLASTGRTTDSSSSSGGFTFSHAVSSGSSSLVDPLDLDPKDLPMAGGSIHKPHKVKKSAFT